MEHPRCRPRLRPDGYLSGNGLLTALGLGRLAGEHAAASLCHR
jgi:hypothetical protein